MHYICHIFYSIFNNSTPGIKNFENKLFGPSRILNKNLIEIKIFIIWKKNVIRFNIVKNVVGYYSFELNIFLEI